MQWGMERKVIVSAGLSVGTAMSMTFLVEFTFNHHVRLESNIYHGFCNSTPAIG